MGRKSEQELLAEINDARMRIDVGKKYAHYKHPNVAAYVVTDLAIIESSEQIAVIYRSLALGINWIRSLENFLDKVEVDGKSVARFSLVS